MSSAPTTQPLHSARAELLADPRFVYEHVIDARDPHFATLATPLPTAVLDASPATRLWSHQVDALNLVRGGTSTVVSTATGSGKSLIYQLAIAESISTASHRTALALFPTKALAHDQLRGFGLFAGAGVVAGTYDGDADADQRAWVRDNANVVLTNPEMLHGSILANHKRWASFLMGLDYVVIDELHVLRGVFGSHVGNILRRLRRLCHRYGSDPTFILSSATIGEPDRLASELCGIPVTAVSNDGSPQGERRIVLWNPVELDPTGEREFRPSMISESAGVARTLAASGNQTLVFCRSRKLTELVASQVADVLGPERHVRAYRGGYLGEERREIEAAFAAGSLDVVVATSALELGIDIGGLSAIVLSGFPGTTASMWQQIGRAGRDGSDSLSVLIAGNDQLDHWFMRHPAETFQREPERAVINVSNPSIIDAHIACAAYEMPIAHGDEQYWDDPLDDSVRRLVLDDQLGLRPRDSGTVAVWNHKRRPTRGINLRSAGGGQVSIYTDSDDFIGTMESSRATSALHEGAVYLHQGKHWLSTALDLDAESPYAVVEPTTGAVYTQARSDSDVAILEIDDSYRLGSVEVSVGTTRVSEQVTGYQVKDSFTHEVLSRVPLELPATELTTRSFWFTIPPAMIAEAGVIGEQLPGTLHAAEHGAIGILPLFAICDRWDVGGLSTVAHKDTGLPTIFIHEAFAGGVGIADLGFQSAERLLTATLSVIERCGCTGGCPGCVQSPKCGNLNEPLDKAGASRLLRAVLHARNASAGQPGHHD